MRRPLFRFALAGLVSAALLSACEDGADILIIDEPSSTILVETNADEGEGSLRAALDAASADPAVNSIQVTPGLGTVSLASSLEFTGNQSLRIVGNGLGIDGSGCGCALLVADGGGDLDLFDLTLKNGSTGLRVSVPAGAGEVVAVRLVRLTVENNDGHGVQVAEAGSGSASSLKVEVVSSVVRQNGYADGSTDLDGVRVEELGEGTLTFVSSDSDFLDNAGDGVDLREAGSGDLIADVQASSFDENGEQPQSISEVEDGFDASEVGVGSLDVRIIGGTAEGNHGQGVELAESGAGDLRATLSGLTASDNRGDNIRFREDLDAEGGAVPGAGGIIATLTEVTSQEADGDGAHIQEIGAGDLNVQIQDGDFSQNVENGLNVRQEGTGKGRLHLVRVVTDSNGGLPVTSAGTAVTEGEDQTTLVRVKNNEDSGFGSFRAALDLASEDPGISSILFDSGLGLIRIFSSLEFTGTQDLTISGSNTLVEAENCDCDALVVTGGGDLTLERLAIRNASENGIFMEIPADATELVTVTLDGVNILDNGLHGFHLDDLADGSGAGSNSAAGILLVLENTLIQGNGFRQDVTDRDGIRVGEGGSGGIELRMTGSGILANAGDGLELKESGLGEVVVAVSLSQIDENGSQPQNPDALEDGLDIQETGPGSVRVEYKGLETQVATLQDNGDLGIQITEEGSGDVVTELDRVLATGNGAGVMEVVEDADVPADPLEGSGNVEATFNQVTAGGALQDGIRLTEYGFGDISLTARGLDSSDNGGDGVWLREYGIGNILVDVRNSFFDDNGALPLDPDDLGAGFQAKETGAGTADLRFLDTSLSRNPDGGLDVEEEGSGDLRGTLTVVSAVSNGKDNVRLAEDLEAKGGAATGSGSLFFSFTELTATGAARDGVQVSEHGDGSFTGQIALSTIGSNADDGVDALQEGAGSGALQLATVTLTANGDQNTAASGVTVTGG